MDPIIGGALIGGAANLFGGISSARAQRKANQMNYLIAKENREFQERMSSTAHQREVIDLRKAGLNPILSATGGPGASTPGGAVAQMEPANPLDRIGEAIHSALAIRRAKQEIANMKATEKKTEQDRLTSWHLSEKAWQDSLKSKAETELIKHGIPGAKAEGDLWRQIEDAGSSAKGIERLIRLLPLLRRR